ncbi:ATP-binding cassette domain-containing protein [Trueperella pecoris]|uniref:ATP-binding cassette domain-containing protein n=1 Tax=Trueperella pecoris TaxID=2733571 RepID=A0A7M1R1J3_9ACTO|nr:ATP-binding cassette domain-containing protein [Trueperella pecoris]QOR47544.1 ATP-binding cassette domain-containing protein [Trueperella pecoris]
MTYLLEVEDLSCTVPGRTLFTDLSFSLSAGENIAIVGRSGVGKSTLLAAIMGLRNVAHGDIRILGESMVLAKAKRKREIRRERLGIVHQDGQLIDELTAVENVAVALMLVKDQLPELWEEAEKRLTAIGVPPHTLASKLSGGEIQRTALVRALASQPSVILADEPTGSLDEETRNAVAQQLFSTTRDAHAALVIVTHDPVIAAYADKVVELNGEPSSEA